MKIRLFIKVVIFILSSGVYAYQGFGVCNFGKEIVSSVICYGPTVLKQTTVHGDVKVTGSLKGLHINTRSMVVEGDVELDHSEVNGSVNITGKLIADYVEFKKGVAVTGHTVTLTHSKINGLMTVTSTSVSPYIKIKCGSVITGSVLFDQKAGVIQITNDSVVQGKIVNGSLEFIKDQCS